MAKKPVITPEQIEAGVQKNVNEYSARVAALRALHDDHAYNPQVDPLLLQKNATEASRGVVGLPAMPVFSDGGVVSGAVRDPRRDAVAEAEDKSKGGRRRAVKETEIEESESGEGQAGDGRVQAGDASQRFQTRPQSPFTQAGHSDSAVPVWTEQTWEAESEEAVKAMVPEGAKAVEVRQVFKATCLVKQG
jgi:hypothetical protein